MKPFLVFLVVSITLYGALHVYVYRKLTAAFAPGRLFRYVFAGVCGLMIAAPFLGRGFDHDGHAGLSRLVNLPAYLWLAWVFWFCMLGFLCDAWNGALALVARARPKWGDWRLPRQRQAPVLLVLVLTLSVWGLVEATRPVVREVVIHHPAFAGLPAPLRVVQVSDVHVNPLRSPVWNRLVCRRIAALQPDLIVSTGDMVDSSMHNIGARTGPWADLKPPLGKYAVLGNHEYYIGVGEALAFLDQAGFRVLRGQGVNVGDRLRLVGVDDPTGRALNLPCAHDERQALAGPAGERYTILLKHQPTVRAPGLFHLQLSGHTHGGQLFPFHGLVRLVYRYSAGLHDVAPGSQIYVSRGVGTFGPPLRLLAPPELTLFLLRP